LRFILGLLNSRLLNWFYQKAINPEEGEALAQVKRGHLAQLPVAQPGHHAQSRLASLVREVLAAKLKKPEGDTSQLEQQINREVYALYGLTPEEIQIVEDSSTASDGTTDAARELSPLRVEAAPPPVVVQAEGRQAVANPKPRERETTPATAPPPIDQTERDDVLCQIRQLFSDGQSRDRETTLRDLTRGLGYERLGPRIRETLATDLLTAVRRGILANDRGVLSLQARSIEEYDRSFLKEQFLAAIGRNWIEREEAIRLFARWLGFARTGPVIDDAARSLINGLLREERLESDGPSVRRT
jgi:hypothetical protein